MWLQSYLDDQLRSDADSHFLHSIAIVGHDGTVLAQIFSFPKLKPDEVTSIMNEFDNPGSLAATGLHIGETKYVVIGGEPGAVIRAKTISRGATIKKTTLAFIIGIYSAPLTSMVGNMVVEEMGEYLIQQGH